MSTRVLIVDDERLARVGLRRLLENCSGVDVVGEAASVAAAASALVALNPDLIFLDIALPDGSGFDLFTRAAVRAPVVFVTAFDQHAVRAFEVQALDYLLKPVTPEAVARVLARLGREAPPRTDEDAPLLPDGILELSEGRTLRFVRLGDITHIAAADDYAEVWLTSGESVLTSRSLRYWEQRLSPVGFVRLSRTALVNFRHVTELATDHGPLAVLRDGKTRLRMSRRQARALRRKLQNP